MSYPILRWVAALLISISYGECAASDLVVSVSYACDRPYDIAVTTRNNTGKTIKIRRSLMPTNPRGGGVKIVARVIEGGSIADIPVSGMIIDLRPDEIALEPYKTVTGSFRLDSYYQVEGLEAKAKIFSISFPKEIVYKNMRYTLSAPLVSVFFERKRIFNSACPLVTVRS